MSLFAKKLWLVFSAIAILFLALPSAKAVNNGMIYQIPTSEYNALVDFFNTVTGYSGCTGWLNPNATQWQFVTVSGTKYDTNGNVLVQGHVVSLNFLPPGSDYYIYYGVTGID